VPVPRNALKTPTGARSAPPIALTQRPRTQPPETILRLLGPRYSQSLECGLAILACFVPERPVWGIAELADEVGLPRSTTHRYASTLTELGHLQQTNRRRYRLGQGVMSLGLAEMGRMDLAEHARQYMQELGDLTGFALGLGVLDEAEVLLVERARGRRRGRRPVDFDEPGSRLPAHCTAIGKLLLADLPHSERHRTVSQIKLRPRRTRNTIASRRALHDELQAIHTESMVTADEEYAPGVYSIAAPIRSACGEVCAALGMDADSSIISLKDLVDALGPHLISTAGRVSARLGYRREDERHDLGFGAPQPTGVSESASAAQRAAAHSSVGPQRNSGGRR
jgi:DNA-binding IclR family transcriptional regulator